MNSLVCKVRIGHLFDFDENGFPKRKRKALELFLAKALEDGSVESLWPSRKFIRILRSQEIRVALRGKYALEFVRTCLDRLMGTLKAQATVGYVQTDLGKRNLVQLLAAHINVDGLATFLGSARNHLEVPT